MGSGVSKKTVQDPVPVNDPTIVFSCIVDESRTKNVGCGLREVLLPEVLDAVLEYGPYLLTFSRPKNLGTLEVFVPYAAIRPLDMKAEDPEVEYVGLLSNLRVSFAHFDSEDRCAKLDQARGPKQQLYNQPPAGWSFALSIRKKA